MIRWAGPLATGAVAVVLLNTGAQNSSVRVTATWAQLGLEAGVTMAVRDMWAHRDLGTAVSILQFGRDFSRLPQQILPPI